MFAVAFGLSQFVGERNLVRRMMESNVELAEPIWTRLNVSWVVFFFAMGLLNLYVVYNFDTDTWVNFKLFGLMGLTALFVIAQAVYLYRHTAEGRRREGAPVACKSRSRSRVYSTLTKRYAGATFRRLDRVRVRDRQRGSRQWRNGDSDSAPADVVRVRITRGMGDAQGLRDAFRYAGKSAREAGKSGVLMDLRAADKKVSTFETLAIGSSLGEFGLARKRIAVLDQPSRFGDTRFLETVAVNRAFCVRAFTDEGEAESWLAFRPDRGWGTT